MKMDVLGFFDISPYIIYTIVLCILLYLHHRWFFSYWREQGVHGPAPYPFIGNLPFFRKKPFHESLDEEYKIYKRTYGLYEPTINMLIISDPEDIKTILVKDFDKFPNRRVFPEVGDAISDNFLSVVGMDKWHSIRNAISPTFSGLKLKKMCNLIIECNESLDKVFEDFARKDEKFDARRIFGAFSLDVIALTAFRLKINSLTDPKNKFVQLASRVFSPKMNIRMLTTLFLPNLAKFLKLSIIDQEVGEYFRTLVTKVMKIREDESETHADFLTLMKECMKKSQSKIEEQKANGNHVSDGSEKGTDYPITEDVVISQCILFFLAGYETTASALTMLAYNLAIYQNVQEKLIEEIDSTIEKMGSLSYDAVNEMPYLDAVVKENLRLYPPGSRIEREASENYMLGDIYLKKGTFVGIPIYSIHRDPEFWTDPEKFCPERFLDDQTEIIPYTYMPFGFGQRNCVAKRFALLEIKLALAHVLQKCRFVKCSDTTWPPKILGTGFMQPTDIFLKVERRKMNK